MNINQYLDSTYLKTATQANITEAATKQNVIDLVNEAIENNFKLAMIRPEFVAMAKDIVAAANSEVLIGTVIGFHEGTYSTNDKLSEAQKAIKDNVSAIGNKSISVFFSNLGIVNSGNPLGISPNIFTPNCSK